jgi:selenocysteine lyase/cysteine desulfurase
VDTVIAFVAVNDLRDHSVRLNRRLVAALDPRRFRPISVHLDRSPIVTFAVDDAPALEARLRVARLVVTLSATQLRVSPGIYNTEDDIDRLARVLNARG